MILFRREVAAQEPASERAARRPPQLPEAFAAVLEFGMQLRLIVFDLALMQLQQGEGT